MLWRRCELTSGSIDDLSQFRSLERLEMAGCKGLGELPSDLFRHLTALQHLDMSVSPDLAAMPDSLGRLAALEHLDISDCSELRVLPDCFSRLSMLTGLDLGR